MVLLCCFEPTADRVFLFLWHRCGNHDQRAGRPSRVGAYPFVGCYT